MTRKYPCPEKKDGCEYGGNKTYNYGFVVGSSSFCRNVNKWVHDIEICPLIAEESEDIHPYDIEWPDRC